MRRTLMTGLLLGLILACLSWTATLVSGAFHGTWTVYFTTGIYWVTIFSWLWLGWRFCRSGAGSGAAATAGGIAGGVFGILVSVIQIFLPQTGFGPTLTATQGAALVIGEILVTAAVAAVVTMLGHGLARLLRRLSPGEGR